MLRVPTLLWVSIAMQGAAMAQQAEQAATLQVHGKSLTLSCAEWKRNPNGSWTSTGPLLVGTEILKDVTLRGAKETKVLDAKCEPGSVPSVTPAPADSPGKHSQQKRAPAEQGGNS